MKRNVTLLVLAISVACASAGGRAGERLESGRWNLEQLRGASVMGANTPYVTFVSDSRVEGSGGCNRMSGPYTREKHELSFGGMISTKMACADNRLNRQETEFFDVLRAVREFRIEKDRLYLLSGNGTPIAVLVGG